MAETVVSRCCVLQFGQQVEQVAPNQPAPSLGCSRAGKLAGVRDRTVVSKCCLLQFGSAGLERGAESASAFVRLQQSGKYCRGAQV